MKKGFLLIGMLASCATVFAQQEAGWVTANNETLASIWGWNGETWSADKTNHDAGTLIAESENVTVKTTFDDDCATTLVNRVNLLSYTVNDIKYSAGTNGDNIFRGVVGNTNGMGINLTNSSNSINKGWVFDYSVKDDGYLTLITAAALNKNLYVLHGEESYGEVDVKGAMAYEFYCLLKSEVEGIEGLTASYKLPANADGYIDENELSKYIDSKGNILWPYRIIVDNPEATVTGANPTSAVVFPVKANNHYYVYAQGSKLVAGPYVFTKEYPNSVTFTKLDEGTGEEVDYKLISSEGSAVDTVEAVENADAPVYNMMGVRVNADAKGILIRNGKKFIRK